MSAGRRTGSIPSCDPFLHVTPDSLLPTFHVSPQLSYLKEVPKNITHKQERGSLVSVRFALHSWDVFSCDLTNDFDTVTIKGAIFSFLLLLLLSVSLCLIFFTCSKNESRVLFSAQKLRFCFQFLLTLLYGTFSLPVTLLIGKYGEKNCKCFCFFS